MAMDAFWTELSRPHKLSCTAVDHVDHQTPLSCISHGLFDDGVNLELVTSDQIYYVTYSPNDFVREIYYGKVDSTSSHCHMMVATRTEVTSLVPLDILVRMNVAALKAQKVQMIHRMRAALVSRELSDGQKIELLRQLAHDWGLVQYDWAQLRRSHRVNGLVKQLVVQQVRLQHEAQTESAESMRSLHLRAPDFYQELARPAHCHAHTMPGLTVADQLLRFYRCTHVYAAARLGPGLALDLLRYLDRSGAVHKLDMRITQRLLAAARP